MDRISMVAYEEQLTLDLYRFTKESPVHYLPTTDEENMTTRIQLDMPQERLRELEELMSETGTSSRKDLLNDALTLFEWAVNERKAGRTIASVDEQEQKYKEVVMPSLERARSSARHQKAVSAD